MVSLTRGIFTVVCFSMVAGCASKTSVKPTYVSSAVYKDYSCAQLEQEYRRVNQHIRTHSGKPAFDTSNIGVGIHAGRGGVYPTISVGMGRSKDMEQTRLSRVLGERDAVTESARFKGCDFRITHLKQPKAGK